MESLTPGAAQAESDDGEKREYEYAVHVIARETFSNLLMKQGLNLFLGIENSHVKFRSDRLLDMSRMKANGVIASYSISRVRRVVELFEEG